MGPDQLFKEVLQAYLEDFLQLFFPDVAEHLDLATRRFLDKEFFTDTGKGNRREMDVVAQFQTHEGSPEIVLVHVEIERKKSRELPKRMFQYYSMLRQRHGAPVFPVVVYLSGGREGLVEEEYRESLFGTEVIQFCYKSVRLAKLDAGEYVGKGTSLSAALAALMDRRKSGDSLLLRASMMQQVVESDRNNAAKFLLQNLIGTYFQLSADEKKSFNELLLKKEYREVREMELTWADEMRKEGREKGRKEGRQEGRQAGLLAGKRETLLRLLDTKFGPLPEHTLSLVQAMESVDELDDYLDRILEAKSLAEMGLVG